MFDKIKIQEYEKKYVDDCINISETVGITFIETFPIKYVALYEGRVVGFSCVKVDKKYLTVDSMAVLYEFRKKGIGKLFLKKIIEIALKNKMNIIEVYADERAFSFWDKEDFELIAELKTTYKMRLDLNKIKDLA